VILIDQNIYFYGKLTVFKEKDTQRLNT
jgi:hypothetical protein